jgi:DNA-binding IscR family transcriptional regulator
MLEQLLLQLRRAGLVEARRGRYGGYRLGRPARAIPVAAVLEAVAGGAGLTAPLQAELAPTQPGPQPDSLGKPAAAAEPEAGAVAEERVLAALERRLKRALERELRDLSLEELHYDQRSWQESLSNDGGLLLG